MLWFYFNLQFESVLFLFQSLDQSGIGSATTITPFVPEESFWLVFSTYQLLVAVFIAYSGQKIVSESKMRFLILS